MKGYVYRFKTFYRNMKSCMAAAKRDCDSWYHIPKSRFNEGSREAGTADQAPKAPARNAFLGSFRDCFVRAWQDSDDHYYLPKRRLADSEFNQTAYRSKEQFGTLGKIAGFPGTLKSCLNMAWNASDTLYYLPKSRYQDREFVTGLMEKIPSPRGKLFIRPFTIGLGVVGGGGVLEGWVATPSKNGIETDFVVAEEVDDHSGWKEIEM